MNNKLIFATALAAFLALSGTGAHAQGLEMRVEEPASMPAPPINPDADAGAWKKEGIKADLNRKERAAYEERRKKVEELATEVRAKREALVNSRVGDRAARVKDLENLVLEKKQGKGREKVLEKKLEKLEARMEKSLEKRKEKLDRKKGKGRDKTKG